MNPSSFLDSEVTLIKTAIKNKQSSEIRDVSSVSKEDVLFESV